MIGLFANNARGLVARLTLQVMLGAGQLVAHPAAAVPASPPAACPTPDRQPAAAAVNGDAPAVIGLGWG
jgi:hypothetical protein